jgi:hypothetical protein
MSENDKIIERLDRLQTKLTDLLHRCIDAKAKYLAKKNLTSSEDDV